MDTITMLNTECVIQRKIKLAIDSVCESLFIQRNQKEQETKTDTAP